jgi:hypothetical protein
MISESVYLVKPREGKDFFWYFVILSFPLNKVLGIIRVEEVYMHVDLEVFFILCKVTFDSLSPFQRCLKP